MPYVAPLVQSFVATRWKRGQDLSHLAERVQQLGGSSLMLALALLGAKAGEGSLRGEAETAVFTSLTEGLSGSVVDRITHRRFSGRIKALVGATVGVDVFSDPQHFVYLSNAATVPEIRESVLFVAEALGAPR